MGSQMLAERDQLSDALCVYTNKSNMVLAKSSHLNTHYFGIMRLKSIFGAVYALCICLNPLQPQPQQCLANNMKLKCGEVGGYIHWFV